MWFSAQFNEVTDERPLKIGQGFAFGWAITEDRCVFVGDKVPTVNMVMNGYFNGSGKLAMGGQSAGETMFGHA